MAYVSLGDIRRGTPFEFKAEGAEIVSSTHKTSHPVAGGSVSVIVKVAAVSGTTPTLSVVVEGSNDDTTWFTLGTIGSNGYTVGSVASAAANITTVSTARAAFPLTEYVRTRSVIGGTMPSFNYSVIAFIS